MDLRLASPSHTQSQNQSLNSPFAVTLSLSNKSAERFTKFSKLLLRDKFSQTRLDIQSSDTDWMYGIGKRNKPRKKGQAIIFNSGRLNNRKKF